MARRNTKKSSIGCLFWIALILLILVIFLFNRETIQNVLNETGFMDVIEGQKKQPEVTRIENTDEPKNEKTVPESEDKKPEKISDIIITEPEPENKKPDENIELQVTSAPEEKTVTTQSEPEIPQKVRRSKLYFVEITDDGGIKMKEIVRPVYYIDSPLTETVKTLLQGLSASELNMGLISLIPEQTKLLSISIKNNVAYLNFSEDFRFNSFGVDGYKAQLKQIVFTTTEFTNINAVQILIDGKINDYMGPEGVYIGTPLKRSDFD